MIPDRHHNIQILDSDEVTLATIIAEGLAQQPVPLPAKLPPMDDLRKQPVAHKREIVFSESPGKFFINGQQFAMDRVDTTVNLGDVEEWTIRNESDEMHTFRIHQLDFQVVEGNGQKAPFIGVQDKVTVPVRGIVQMLVPFTDPVIVGKFVAGWVAKGLRHAQENQSTEIMTGTQT